MSGIGGLDRPIIDAMLRNLGLDPVTRTELANFLMGRKTTVTNTDEFTRGARSIIQDTEAVGGLESGSVIGEVIGALEGGLIVGKVSEIISELQVLMRGGPAEDAARSNGRARGDGGGPTYGPIGEPASTPEEIQEQLRKARARDAKAGKVPEERKFRDRDPQMRKRPGQGPVEDVFEDVELGGADGGKEDDPEEEKVRPTRDPPEGFPTGFVPHDLPTGKGRKRRGKPKDQGPKDRGKTSTSEFEKSREIITDPEFVQTVQIGDDSSWLRPEFTKGGTDIVDENANRIPENIENQEWVDFSFVATVDDQNLIEMDNLYADGKIRFQEPMYLPRYQNPTPSPTDGQMDATTTPMIPEIQLYQAFQRKFEPADYQSRLMRNNDVLSMEYNPQPYNPRLWGKQRTWNPV